MLQNLSSQGIREYVFPPGCTEIIIDLVQLPPLTFQMYHGALHSKGTVLEVSTICESQARVVMS
jgi:hypothetical protein